MTSEGMRPQWQAPDSNHISCQNNKASKATKQFICSSHPSPQIWRQMGPQLRYVVVIVDYEILIGGGDAADDVIRRFLGIDSMHSPCRRMRSGGI